MSEKSKELIQPVLNSIICIGIAGISSIGAGVLGAGLLGLAGNALVSVLGGITGNLASDQLLKIDNRGLLRWWKRKGPDLSNHDLFFALQKALIDALKALEAQYRSDGFTDDKEYLASVQKKIDFLCNEIEQNFLNFFGDNMTEADILRFGEKTPTVEDSPLSRFFSDDDFFKKHDNFAVFFQLSFPSRLVQAFTEQLKTNRRAWIAYQRLLLQETQEQLHQNFNLSQEISSKIDDLANAMATAGTLYNCNQSLADQFIQQHDNLRECFLNAQEDMQQFMHELHLADREFESEWRKSRIHDLDFQNIILEKVEHLNTRLGAIQKNTAARPPQELDEKELDEHILPAYLDWIKGRYNSIKLPDVREKVSMPPIPLERVYVALRLFNAKNEQELLFSSGLMNSKVEARIKAENKTFSPDEIARIKSEILQENPTMRSLPQLQGGSSNNLENQSLNLAEAFQKFRYLVILGDPGSGKSTLSYWLMLKMANGLANFQTSTLNETIVGRDEVEIVPKDPNADKADQQTINLGPARLPILIKISDYFKFWQNYSFNPANPEMGRGIIDFLGTGLHIKSQPNFSCESFQNLAKTYLRRGQTVIILDGLDEVVSDRASVNNEISDFIRDWVDAGNKDQKIFSKSNPGSFGGNQLIVTSRIVGYHANPLPVDKFAKVYIEKMDDPSLNHFCDVWTRQMFEHNTEGERITPEEREIKISEQASALKNALLDPKKPQIRILATNPLLVTMLAMQFRFGNGHLPNTRVALYKESISILLEKWRDLKRHNVTTDEISKLLTTLAAHIHTSTTDDIHENDLVQFLEKHLCLAVGKSPESGIPPEIKNKAGHIMDLIRSDVGLLSDRGGFLYHFIHRTFQEYLAGLYLLRDDSKAPEEIIDRIADPIWREPIVLALGFANQTYNQERFDQLLHKILNAEDEIKDLIPRTILLLALALPEMSKEKLQYANFKKIVVEFLNAFGRLRNLSQSEAVLQQIKTVLQKLREGDYAPEFYQVCNELLKEPDYGDAQWAVLNLAANDAWAEESWLYDLIEHLNQDSPEWKWPIDRTLLSLLSGADFKVRNCEALKFRNKLMQNQDWENFILQNPAWMRLITVLYGGWPSDPEKKVSKFHQLENMRFRLFEGALDLETEGYQLAVKLDTEGGEINAMNRGHFVFNIRSIHRDGPFTRLLLKSVNEGAEAASLIPAFLDVWQIETDPETRALSLLALSALGHNTAMMIYQNENEPADRLAIERFLAHLKRIKSDLQSALIRFRLVLQHAPSVLGAYSSRHLPTQEKGFFSRIILDCFARAGLPPLEISDLIPGQLSWYLPEDELSASVRHNMEILAWIARTGTFTFDPVGKTQQTLQQHGDILAGANGNFLFQTLLLLPIQEYLSIKSRYTLPWQMPKMPFPDTEPTIQMLYVLETIDGLTPNLAFLKAWMLRRIWPLVLNNPETIPYACTILLKLPNGMQILQELLPDTFSRDNALNLFDEMIVGLQDPLCRFFAIDNLFVAERSPVIQKQFIRAFLEIQDPKAWFLALDRLLNARYIEQHLPDGTIIRLQIIDLRAILDVNQKRPLAAQIEEKLEQLEDDTERAFYKMLFLKNLEEEDLKLQVFRMMDLIVETPEEMTKVIFLRIILTRFGKIARKYPHWSKINASFQVPELLNFALQKDFLSVFNLDRKMDPQTYLAEKDGIQETKLEPDARPLAVLIGVDRMAQQLTDRFSTHDLIEYHADRLLEPAVRDQSLQFFVANCPDGLFLNRHLVEIFDELIRRREDDTLQLLLPLLEMERSSDLEIVSHWEHHSVPLIASFYQLLALEAGILNHSAVQSVLAYLGEFPDRLRYRAAIAIHGPNPTSHQPNRRFFTSKLDLANLLEQYEINLEMRISPAVKTTFSWFSHNLVHNSVEVVENLIQVIESKGDAGSKAEQLALKKLEFCTTEVLKYLGDKLPELKGTTAKLVWLTIARMMYSNTDSPRRIKMLEDAIQKGIQSPETRESLRLLRMNQITSTTVSEHLLAAGENEIIPENIIATAKERLNTHTVIDPYTLCEKKMALEHEFYRLGATEYYSSWDETIAAQNFSQVIAGKPYIIKALLDWAQEVLDDELVDVKSHHYLGSALIGLLSQISRDYPETLESLLDRQKNLDLLFDCISNHEHFSVRMNSAVILCRLRQVDPRSLKALVNALKDVQPVRDAVLAELKYLSRIFNQATFDALKQLVFSPNGTVALAATQLLGTVAGQSSFDIHLRKQTISVLARALRDQLNHPERKCLIYSTPMNSVIPKPVFTNRLENALYKELVALSGVTTVESVRN